MPLSPGSAQLGCPRKVQGLISLVLHLVLGMAGSPKLMTLYAAFWTAREGKGVYHLYTSDTTWQMSGGVSSLTLTAWGLSHLPPGPAPLCRLKQGAGTALLSAAADERLDQFFRKPNQRGAGPVMHSPQTFPWSPTVVPIRDIPMFFSGNMSHRHLIDPCHMVMDSVVALRCSSGWGHTMASVGRVCHSQATPLHP